MLKSYTYSLRISINQCQWSIQLNAFGKSVIKMPMKLPLSRTLWHLSGNSNNVAHLISNHNEA